MWDKFFVMNGYTSLLRNGSVSAKILHSTGEHMITS